MKIKTSDFKQLKNDSFGKEVLKLVRERYGGTPADVYSSYEQEDGKPVIGSNTFSLFGTNRVAKELGARVMYPEDSEWLLSKGKLPEARSVYYDLGVALDFSQNNHDLAIKLWEQLPEELRDFGRLPAVMLELDVQRNGDELEFGYDELSKMRTAKILGENTGKFEKDDVELVRSGFPSKLGKGSRRLYTSTQYKSSKENLGLSGLLLYVDLGLGADWDGLASSGDDGRVVLGCGEATRLDYCGAVKELSRERDKAIAEIEGEVRERKEVVKDDFAKRLRTLR